MMDMESIMLPGKIFEVDMEYRGWGSWPYSPGSGDCDHWLITVNGVEVPFYMGLGHKGNPPELDDVIESLIGDSRCEQLTFREFCRDCGYSTDSISALNIYNSCKGSIEKVEQMTGMSIEELEEAYMEY